MPVAVMPALYHFQTKDFAAIAKDCQAACLLFARERKSYELLLSTDLPPNIRVELDHDMALSLGHGPLVQRYRSIRENSPKDYD